ncbi:hypothetical protein ENUP19_0020G0030 [Entamoeba nuttalli]|uniref:Uncharacterized protein n=1 Tax=Entamoeba nuttalli TaxID=412467 RepID=A0ABQ0D8Y2_9EUKA
MSEEPSIQCESMHHTAPKPGKKNFGNLARSAQTQGVQQKRLGRIQTNRQYFDSAEYSLHKVAQKKEEEEEKENNKENKEEK